MNRIWKITVPGLNGGYSFAIGGDINDELYAISEALNIGMFEDERHSRYAMVEEITDDVEELKHWHNEIVIV